MIIHCHNFVFGVSKAKKSNNFIIIIFLFEVNYKKNLFTTFFLKEKHYYHKNK
jgi:hypothetical protein